MGDKLFDLALQFKKEKLWKKLWDNELFAVTLSNGELGYCCVMGHGGDYTALAVYVGQEGANSYWAIRSAQYVETEVEFQEVIYSQSCLHCSFENKDALNEEELAAARDYAKRNGISFRGKGAFPQFICYQPYCYPWPIRKQEEEEILCQALSAAHAVSYRLEKEKKAALGFRELRYTGSNQIPLLTLQGEGFVWSVTELPKAQPARYPKPDINDELLLGRLKRMRKKGDLQCDLIRLPEAVVVKEGEPPRYPILLFSLNRDEEYLFPCVPVTGYEENPQLLLDTFCRELEKQKTLPQTIYARDERTENLFRGLCKRLSIQLVRQRLLPDLDEVENDFFNNYDVFGDEEIPEEMLEEVFDLLSEMSEEELKTMPSPLVADIHRLIEEGEIPDFLVEKLSRALGLTPEAPQEENGIILFPGGWKGGS